MTVNTVLVNLKISKSFDPYKLVLNFADKINLKRNDKYVVLSNLSLY